VLINRGKVAAYLKPGGSGAELEAIDEEEVQVSAAGVRAFVTGIKREEK